MTVPTALHTEFFAVLTRQVGRPGVAERFVLPMKPDNAGGGKGPLFNADETSGEDACPLCAKSDPEEVSRAELGPCPR